MAKKPTLSEQLGAVREELQATEASLNVVRELRQKAQDKIKRQKNKIKKLKDELTKAQRLFRGEESVRLDTEKQLARKEGAADALHSALIEAFEAK